MRGRERALDDHVVERGVGAVDELRGDAVGFVVLVDFCDFYAEEVDERLEVGDAALEEGRGDDGGPGVGQDSWVTHLREVWCGRLYFLFSK